MSENLRHWEALRKVDPRHTKEFKRSGGFSGTAIKPIYMTKMLTEHFGPCGTGWGMEKPEFQLVIANDETLVFCTATLWYEDGGKRATVYGVGGDKVAGKNKYGPFTDDEAFKKSYTDALSNAMKQIGTAADVHMGLFENAKYVNELRQEFADEAAPPATSVKRPTALATPPADSPQALKAQANELARKLKAADNLSTLERVMDDARDFLKTVPEETYQYFGKLYETRRNAMETPS